MIEVHPTRKRKVETDAYEFKHMAFWQNVFMVRKKYF
jgi:hypothetical protein